MFCANCGSELEDKAKFCGNCGSPVNSNQESEDTQNTYNVVVTGAILDGFELDNTKSKLEKVLKLKRSQLDKIFEKGNVTIKKDVDKATAEKFQSVFKNAGADCKVVSNSVQKKDQKSSPLAEEDRKKPSVSAKPDQEKPDSISGSDIEKKLWNPNAAAGWSLLFSPIFGGWLHAKNWSELGDEEKAKKSMFWAYGGIAAAIMNLAVPFISLAYLIAWYFIAATDQVKHIKEKFENKYAKKSWGKPLGIAVPIYLFFVVIAISTSSYEEYKDNVNIEKEASTSNSKVPDKSTTAVSKKDDNTTTSPSYSKGRIIKNGLVCFSAPEKVGEFLYRLEKYNSLDSSFCRLNDGGREIPVYIIKNSHVNGEDVSEVKVDMGKDSFWTLTSNIDLD